MFEQLRERLAGVVAIAVTPFDGAGRIDEGPFVRIVERMVDAGIRVVTPNGNTSEYYSLTDAERARCLDLAVEAVGGRATILAGVGGSVASAVEAAIQARGAGADAIMVHQPAHPFVSNAGWLEYHREIARTVPDLGVVLYLRNARITGATIADLARSAPNLVGVKYAVADPVRFGTVLRECPDPGLVWIAGLAELSAPGYWALGASGFTSGFANVDPELSLRMLEALRQGDTRAAMQVWDLIRPFEELRALNESENNVSVVKEALAQLGLCAADVRPPISALGSREKELVTAMMDLWSPDAVGPRATA